MASFQPPVDVRGDGYLSTVPVSLGRAAFALNVFGFILLGLFFVLEGSKRKPSPIVSLLIAIASSLAIGFGFVITFMWAGIFV